MNHFSFRVLLPLAVLTSCKPPPPPAVDLFPVKLNGTTLTFTADDPRLKTLEAHELSMSDKTALHLTGRLVWDEDVTTSVFSPVAGRVASIQGTLGDKVKITDVLAKITSPDYGQAQADAAKADADLALGRQTLERTRDLLRQGVGPQKDVDAAEAAFQQAKSEHDRTKARLAQWGGGQGGVTEFFSLKSPVAGEIVERHIHVGQEVRSDQMLAGMAQYAMPLFIISDPTRMWVMLDVTEQDLRSLHPGMPLEIHTQAYGDRVFPGKLEVIGQSLDPETRTVRVRGTLINHDHLLKAQMYVNINVIVATPKLPRVPLTSVFLRESRPYVFVKESAETFTMRRIVTSSEDAGYTLVSKGLAAGEKVVTEGALLLEGVLEAATSTADQSVP